MKAKMATASGRPRYQRFHILVSPLTSTTSSATVIAFTEAVNCHLRNYGEAIGQLLLFFVSFVIKMMSCMMHQCLL